MVSTSGVTARSSQIGVVWRRRRRGGRSGARSAGGRAGDGIGILERVTRFATAVPFPNCRIVAPAPPGVSSEGDAPVDLRSASGVPAVGTPAADLTHVACRNPTPEGRSGAAAEHSARVPDHPNKGRINGLLAGLSRVRWVGIRRRPPSGGSASFRWSQPIRRNNVRHGLFGHRRPVSDSPRKLLRRAKDALERLEETLDRYPEARAELTGQLGEARLVALRRATSDVRDAAAALSANPESQ